ncbi:hypothetical protein F4809DRAFT_640470 [Biscogniauxia mediterranea]|nr:hypothetical protein F4809DRAFT_640470 [Biscogniauxia mediterranea]
MSGTNKGIAWTSESHEALIISFFDVTKPLSLEKQTAVAEAMNQRGYKVSWEAIRQLYQSIFFVLDAQIPKESQERIVARMRAKGYDVNWNGIR